MTRCAWVTATWGLFILTLGAQVRAADAQSPFDGEWHTSFGTVTLKQTGNAVTGTYGKSGEFNLKGSVAGKKLAFEYQEGQAKGDGAWTLDTAGHAFRGTFK